MNRILRTKGVVSGKRAVLGFSAGFKCLLEGLGFVYGKQRGDLSKYYLPPMFLGFVVLVGGWIFVSFVLGDIVNWIWNEPKSGDYDWQWVFTLFHILWKAVFVLVWIILAAASLLLSLVLFMIAAAPFNDILSEKTEGILGTWTPRPFSVSFLFKDLGHTVGLELSRLGIKLAWLLPLFIISMVIPVLGQVFYIVFGGYLLAKFLGMDYVDWSLARRGYTWRERYRFAKQNRWALTGFGTGMIIALMVPFAFVVVWPGAVAGGTILCTRLDPEDRRDRGEGR